MRHSDESSGGRTADARNEDELIAALRWQYAVASALADEARDEYGPDHPTSQWLAKAEREASRRLRQARASHARGAPWEVDAWEDLGSQSGGEGRWCVSVPALAERTFAANLAGVEAAARHFITDLTGLPPGRVQVTVRRITQRQAVLSTLAQQIGERIAPHGLSDQETQQVLAAAHDLLRRPVRPATATQTPGAHEGSADE